MHTSSPQLALLCVGDELLDGRTADRNAHTLGAYARTAGWPLTTVRFVSDDPEEIRRQIKEMIGPAVTLLVAGGLGPTLDDRTREAVAAAADRPLEENAHARERLEALFAHWKAPMSPTNLRQVQFPKGATIHPSRFGTADAFSVSIDGGTVLCLPGVPREFTGLMHELLPDMGFTAPPAATATRTFMGLGESALGERIEALDLDPSVALSYLAKWPIVRVGLTGAPDAQALVDATADTIAQALAPLRTPGDAVLISEAAGHLLREKNARLATAESCTGGLIASQVTDVPGASAYFTHGWVCYANEAKIAELGVPASTIDTHGAVSAQTAVAMAQGALREADATIAVSVSGIAGPGGGTPEKPVGLVFLAVATTVGGVVLEARFRDRDRVRFKRATASLAHAAIVRALQDRTSELASLPAVVRCMSFQEVPA